MDPFESYTHSFIVKIWRERLSNHGEQFTWRGHITHLPGGERRYLRALDDFATFVLPYLTAMGVRLKWHQRLRYRLQRGQAVSPQSSSEEPEP